MVLPICIFPPDGFSTRAVHTAARTFDCDRLGGTIRSSTVTTAVICAGSAGVCWCSKICVRIDSGFSFSSAVGSRSSADRNVIDRGHRVSPT
jgi:hypothetical protein